MQLAVIEFARNVLGIKDAYSTEFRPDTKNPIIDIMPEQKDLDKLGGTMRLGSFPCLLRKAPGRGRSTASRRSPNGTGTGSS